MRQSNRREISLIEWAAGAVVVCLVATTACPLLRRDDVTGPRSVCMQNLRQIGVSIQLYADDYNDTYPRTTYDRPSAGLGLHWAVLVQPYVKSQSIFVCLGDHPVPAEYARFPKGNLLPEISYINNYAVIPAHDFWPVKHSQLGRVASTILVGERRRVLPNGVKLKSWKGASGFEPGQPCKGKKFGRDYRYVTLALAEDKLHHVKKDKELLLTRVNWTIHGGGSNYLFVDGHAAYQLFPATLREENNQWGERFYAQSMPKARCD
ncbi:hypothetical protein BH11ARM2_BH11ARM2_01100 [soil metagenome]